MSKPFPIPEELKDVISIEELPGQNKLYEVQVSGLSINIRPEIGQPPAGVLVQRAIENYIKFLLKYVDREVVSKEKIERLEKDIEDRDEKIESLKDEIKELNDRLYKLIDIKLSEA